MYRRSGLIFVFGLSLLPGCQTPAPSATALLRRIDQLDANRKVSPAQSSTRHFEGNKIAESKTTLISPYLLASWQPDTAASQPVDEEGTPTSLPAETLMRGPLPSRGGTVLRDAQRWPEKLWKETVNVYTDPWNLVLLTGGAGAAITLQQEADRAVAEYYDDHKHFSQEWRDAFSFAGSPATHFVLAGLWYATGVLGHDEKTYEVGRTLVDALTVTGVSTMLLKVSVNNHSPNGEDLAFPSWHTSSSVALATVMNEAYGPLVGIPLYGLSALVGIERMEDGEHWVSDVVFGAVLGYVIGETVSKDRRPEIFGGEIVPYTNPETQATGIAWVIKL
ncbi:MAG: hypothetical protein HJJLKODD_00284 [Phycisphaerae bacterium]|nr:hypothetical protein [Phycisphaerae bacterium]